jgi:hypothetical protein
MTPITPINRSSLALGIYMVALLSFPTLVSEVDDGVEGPVFLLSDDFVANLTSAAK